MRRPLVSVFIPVYNREKYILESVSSILNQSFTDFELIVVDDGSTDRTRDILASIKDERLKVYFNDTNMGIPYTRNRGIELASGEYFALLDSDDVATLDRLEKQVDFLNKHPDCAVVGGYIAIINQYSKATRKIKFRHTVPDYIHSSMLFQCPLHNTTIMGRTTLFKKFQYQTDFKMGQDHDLFMRMYLSGHKLYNINRILGFLREHNERTTSKKLDVSISRRKEIVKRQLEILNVNFTETDLNNHIYLSGKYMGSELSPVSIDIDFISWAESWFFDLINANNKTKLYPVNAFKQIIGTRWGQICLLWGDKKVTFEKIRYFMHSPLTRYTLSSLKPNFSLHVLNKTIMQLRLSYLYSSTFALM
jgi:glycosyltransferase involved in cell wall biosynthesis